MKPSSLTEDFEAFGAVCILFYVSDGSVFDYCNVHQLRADSGTIVL